MTATAACGGGEPSTHTARTAASTRSVRVSEPAAEPIRHRSEAAATVLVARTVYGRALVDERGFALYLFTHDRSPRSTCYGACAAAWPPYVVTKSPSKAARGTRASLVGSVKRADSRLQLTYAGHPLYYYVGDRRPRQVLCQAVTEFSGRWYVVAPSGTAIH